MVCWQRQVAVWQAAVAARSVAAVVKRGSVRNEGSAKVCVCGCSKGARREKETRCVGKVGLKGSGAGTGVCGKKGKVAAAQRVVKM